MEKLDIPVFLESGSKRTLAIVPIWPGWCRVSSDEPSVLKVLLEYAATICKSTGHRGVVFS